MGESGAVAPRQRALVMLIRRLSAVLLSTLLWWSEHVVAAVSVADDTGQTVALTAPAGRIVSLAPHITENIFAAGAGERLVAVSDYSDFPEAAQRLPRVSASGEINLEALLALRPDLVVGWESAGYREQLLRLKQFGVAVFISEPRQLDALASTIERLGVLAGTSEVAMTTANQLRQRIVELRQQYAHKPRVTVFYQLWNQPLMTIGASHIINDALRLCGAVSVFADVSGLAPVVDWETAVLRNPALVVFSTGEQDTQAWHAQWAAWPNVDAVRHGAIQEIPSDWINRATPRMVDGVERLCRHVDAARR